MCKIAAVGELESAYAALVASFNHVLTYFYVLVIEHRNHRCSGNLRHHLKLIKFSHKSIYDLFIYNLVIYFAI